jgi:hypothetical protein
LLSTDMLYITFFVRQQQQFTFRYDDTDTLMAELQEFFPYVEMDFMLRGQKHQFERDFKECELIVSVRPHRHPAVLALRFRDPSHSTPTDITWG